MDRLHGLLLLLGVNCPWNPPLPMGSPGNSRQERGHVDEVPFPGSVYGDMD